MIGLVFGGLFVGVGAKGGFSREDGGLGGGVVEVVFDHVDGVVLGSGVWKESCETLDYARKAEWCNIGWHMW